MSNFDTQVGGSHYKVGAIQPVQFILANNMGFCEGTVLKYIFRWRQKGGIEDLEKAIHYLQMLIEWEKSHSEEPQQIQQTSMYTKQEKELETKS